MRTPKSGFATSWYGYKVPNYFELFGSSIIRYWPLDDPADSTAARDISGNNGAGAPTSVTFGTAGRNGRSCATFNGTASKINVYSTAFNTIFNNAEGTAMFWFRVTAAAVWTDATLRVGIIIDGGATGRLYLCKSTTNNLIQAAYTGGVTARTREITCSTLVWNHMTMTWSQAANQFKFYLNGVQGGATQTIGTWNGALTTTNNYVGAYSIDPLFPWSGLLSEVVLLNRPATPTEIQYITSRA
jgi:hypothetical protein